MQRVLITTILIFFGCQVNAQLIADAGPDIAKCKQSDSVMIGSSTPATGGVPPYHYHWYLNDSAYAGGGHYGAINEYQFLDHPDSARPKVIYHNYHDSSFAVLKVTDSLGSVAYDTMIVYFQPGMCFLGYPVIIKAAADTVQIGSNSWIMCSDRFGGYHDFLWSPGHFLDDSTKRFPRCFVPSGIEVYRMGWTNRIGCRVLANVFEVDVRDLGIDRGNSLFGEEAVVIQDNKLIVRLGAQHIPALFCMYDIVGRTILKSKLLEADSKIELPNALSAGNYVYSLSSSHGMVKKGKVEIH